MTVTDKALRFRTAGHNSTQLHNSTAATFRNTTTTLFPNSTSRAALQSVLSTSNASLPLTSFEFQSPSFTNTWRFSSPTNVGVLLTSSSARSLPSILSATSMSNAASRDLSNTKISSTSSTGKLFNTTTATVSVFKTANTSQPLNVTLTTTSYMNITSVPVASITSAPLINGTQPLAANTTISPFHNSTSSVHFVNAAMTRSSNSSTPTPTPTMTTTIDTTCGETSTPFAVQVAQPGGMFDGWFLKLSGDAIIFTPPSAEDTSGASSSPTKFSVESSGHLCAVGRLGTEGNAVIAIAETANATTDATGSGVYFVDPEVLGDIADQGYAALQCDEATPGEELACTEGALQYWVGCGLGLDITSDGDGMAEIGGWNCTGVALLPVYS